MQGRIENEAVVLVSLGIVLVDGECQINDGPVAMTTTTM